MAKKVADHSVVVYRKNEKTGKSESLTVPPNTAFSFTSEELADIERHQPGSTRDPKNEDPDAINDIGDEAPARTPAKGAKAPAAPVETGKGNDL